MINVSICEELLVAWFNNVFNVIKKYKISLSPTIIFEDNLGCNKLWTENLPFSRIDIRHIDIRHKVAKEIVEKESILIQYSTSDKTADIMTKRLHWLPRVFNPGIKICIIPKSNTVLADKKKNQITDCESTSVCNANSWTFVLVTFH